MWFGCIVLASSMHNKCPFDAQWVRDRVLHPCSHSLNRAEKALRELLDLELIILCDKDNREIDRLIDKENSINLKNETEVNEKAKENLRSFLREKKIIKPIP